MSAWGFDGQFGTDTRPPHVSATKAWAKDESAPGMNDGTRLTASIVNRLVGNIRRAAQVFGFTLTQTSDDDLAGLIAAGVAATPHDHNDLYEPLTAKNQPNGYCGLDGGGLIPVARLPAIAITDTFEVASEAAMLALTAQTGDIAIRSDLSRCFVLAALPATTLANWRELVVPAGSVVSVNGRTGAVSLTRSDVGLAKLWARGADIASAATVNLTAATGDYVVVTGSAAITAITLPDGEQSTVRFAGALTLTNGASLILPTGANIVTAAGDLAVFRGEASGVVRCVNYVRANGRSLAEPVASQADAEAGINNTDVMTPLRTAQAMTARGILKALGTPVAMSGPAVDFTGIAANARRITISFSDMSTNGASNILVQLGDSGGIENTGYVGASHNFVGASSFGAVDHSAGFNIPSSAAANSISGSITLVLLSAATNTWAIFGGYRMASLSTGIIMGRKSLSDVLDRLRITTVNGTDTFDAGVINILVE